MNLILTNFLLPFSLSSVQIQSTLQTKPLFQYFQYKIVDLYGNKTLFETSPVWLLCTHHIFTNTVVVYVRSVVEGVQRMASFKGHIL